MPYGSGKTETASVAACRRIAHAAAGENNNVEALLLSRQRRAENFSVFYEKLFHRSIETEPNSRALRNGAQGFRYVRRLVGNRKNAVASLGFKFKSVLLEKAYSILRRKPENRTV